MFFDVLFLGLPFGVALCLAGIAYREDLVPTPHHVVEIKGSSAKSMSSTLPLLPIDIGTVRRARRALAIRPEKIKIWLFSCQPT